MNVVVIPLRGAIWLYRMLVSPLLGANCRYEPSCSVYAGEALRRFGLWHGGFLAVKRVGRCHPWGGSGWDPVPDGPVPAGPVFRKDPVSPDRNSAR